LGTVGTSVTNRLIVHIPSIMIVCNALRGTKGDPRDID
jgi:hypothetical protein